MEDWRKELADFFEKGEEDSRLHEKAIDEKKPEVEAFYSSTVIPAFNELQPELEKQARQVSIRSGTGYAQIIVKFEGREEYSYGIRASVSPQGIYAYPESHFTEKSDGKRYKSQGFFGTGPEDCNISQISTEKIIKDFLRGYKLHAVKRR